MAIPAQAASWQNGSNFPYAALLQPANLKTLSDLPRSKPAEFVWVQEKELARKWTFWSTPLEKYTSIGRSPPSWPRFDFRAYLQGKLLDARKSGQALRVLDVGVGTGRQWADTVNQNRGALEVSFTVYQNLDAVRPYFRHKTAVCAASGIASIFPHGKFNIVVTHYGAHHQLTDLVVGAHSLLVPGGEAVFSGVNESRWVSAEKGRVWAYEHVLCACAEYSLLAIDSPIYESGRTNWFLHLRKN